MNIVLISTYDLGHQSFGLASPAAWLRAEDYVVTSLDLSVSMLDETVVRAADMVAFYLPCLLYTSPSPRDRTRSRMPSSA